jgi:hypothetical protein
VPQEQTSLSARDDRESPGEVELRFGYQQMAADGPREAEAQEWADATVVDLADEEVHRKSSETSADITG